MDAVTVTPHPVNEPVGSFAPGSPERARLQAKLAELAATPTDIRQVIGGAHRRGDRRACRRRAAAPPRRGSRHPNQRHRDRRRRRRRGGQRRRAPPGATLPFDDRAAVFLRAADLLSGPWRETLAAATMLGQSKTAYQAEIDTPCELIDFWRFNVHFARQILADQPISSPGVWNRRRVPPARGLRLRRSPRSTSPRSPATCRPRRR